MNKMCNHCNWNTTHQQCHALDCTEKLIAIIVNCVCIRESFFVRKLLLHDSFWSMQIVNFFLATESIFSCTYIFKQNSIQFFDLWIWRWQKMNLQEIYTIHFIWKFSFSMSTWSSLSKSSIVRTVNTVTEKMRKLKKKRKKKVIFLPTDASI